MPKSLNYKVGYLKRKFGTGKEDVSAGTFISKVNEMKAIKKNNQSNSKVQKIAIMGMV